MNVRHPSGGPSRAGRLAAVAAASALASLAAQAPSFGQAADALVSWKAEVHAAGTPAPTLVVTGHIAPGWHVYALTQSGSGPTPLRVTLDESPLAAAAGPLAGPKPLHSPDQGFGFETFYYEDAVRLEQPLTLAAGARPGTRPGVLQVTIRFQVCSDRECRPPTTVHLPAAIQG